MKWARVENGVVREITDIDPSGRFTPEIEAQFISCGDGVQPNWLHDGATFKAPGPQTPEEVKAAVWAALRAERDGRLKDPDLMDRIDRYRNQRDGGLLTTDTTGWFKAAMEYLQALRDLPANTTDPGNPVWPEPPV